MSDDFLVLVIIKVFPILYPLAIFLKFDVYGFTIIFVSNLPFLSLKHLSKKYASRKILNMLEN